MRAILIGTTALIALLFMGFASSNNLQAGSEITGYWAVNYHDHDAIDQVRQYTNSYLDKGRVQIVTLKKDLHFGELPFYVQNALTPINPKVMTTKPMSRRWHDIRERFGIIRVDPRILSLTNQVTAETMRSTITELVSTGTRTNDTSIDWVMNKFSSYGYDPVHNYNIEVFKEGTSKANEIVIIEGHMDTVGGTVGADDNASGASAVLEAARVFADQTTERSILFLITEGEERGLLGAYRKVKELREQGRLGDVKFVVNMDMIGYNSNGKVDLETEPEFESVVDWMAEQVFLYTDLEPVKVLNAWGSDHVPFIKAGVDTLLTIEHWNTHTPCWHKACDKLDTINFDYAAQIAKLNIAAISKKATLVH
jgi:hypothetical protein